MKNSPVKTKKQPPRASFKFSILAICLTAILAGCGDYGPDMKAQLAENLPNQWEVSGLKIKSWEIINRTPRKWRYQFTATAIPKENLYQNIGSLNNTALLQPAATQGELKLLSGTAVAVFDGGRWRSNFEFNHAAALLESAPQSAFGKNIAIVGNPGFHAFLQSSQIALHKIEEDLGNEEKSLSKNISEWIASNQAFKDSFQKINTDLESEQAQLQKERLNVNSNISREVREANSLLQTAVREKLNAHRTDYEFRTAALTQAHRTRMQELQEKNRDIQNQHISRDEQIEKRRQLREQDLKLQQQHRDQLDQAREHFSIRVKETQLELESQRAKIQDDIRHNVVEQIENSGADLQEKREKQQEILTASHNHLLDQRAQFEQRTAEVRGQKAELVRQYQLLEKLKARMN